MWVIFLILSIIFCVATYILSTTDKEVLTVIVFIVFVVCLVLSIIFLCRNNEKLPEAIDVYRNKTELQINYKIVGNDTIITDSVVIYKR